MTGPERPDDAMSREEELVARAVDGDRAALEEVVRLLQDPLYRLALRMVWRPADAEDATQEILVRVVTRLATWRAEARLLTWAYRIGVNYLLNLRRRTPQEARDLSLDQFRENLADGLAAADHTGPDADPSEIILGGPHAKETTAQAEARFVATDFGAQLLHHGWGHS